MKKILFPIATIASIAIATSPLITSCSKSDGLFHWDYLKDGKYVNDDYVPLEACPLEPSEAIQAGYDKLAQDPNNIAYDLLLAVNDTIDDENTTTKCQVGIKILSYDPQKRALDFKISIDTKQTYDDQQNEGSSSLTCKHIILSISNSRDINESNYKLGTHVTPSEQAEDTYAYLTSGLSGDWSITGRFFTKWTDFDSEGNEYIEEYKDDHCNYNKSTIEQIYADYNAGDTNRWNCLTRAYRIITHDMYYLSKCT